MCGIAGQATRPPAAVNRVLVQRMTEALAHLGPDGEGFQFEPACGLGHRRLSLIDLEHGGQVAILDSPSGGARINMIPRDGGNTFSGDVYLGGMSGAWQSNNITDALKARGLPLWSGGFRLLTT